MTKTIGFDAVLQNQPWNWNVYTSEGKNRKLKTWCVGRGMQSRDWKYSICFLVLKQTEPNF